MPWREAVVERLLMLHIPPGDHIEFRLSSEKDSDLFGLAQRAADSFFTVFALYPTAIALHPAVASLFEASEFVIKAEHQLGTECREALLRGFTPAPIHVECDASVDTRTVAVRFAINAEEYSEAIGKVLLRALSQGTRGGQ